MASEEFSLRFLEGKHEGKSLHIEDTHLLIILPSESFAFGWFALKVFLAR